MRFAALLLAFSLPAAAQIHATHTPPQAVTETKPADSLTPLDFLLGTWTAVTAGNVTGTYTFARDLDGHVLSRTTGSCKDQHANLCQHHDQLTIFPDPTAKAVVALYLDSEGHVIHYAVTTPTPHTVVFLSTDPGPSFRLMYTLDGITLAGKFQIAPPGSAEFHSYLEWSGSRQ